MPLRHISPRDTATRASPAPACGGTCGRRAYTRPESASCKQLGAKVDGKGSKADGKGSNVDDTGVSAVSKLRLTNSHP
eukprot:586969-Pyramimonas_sp.AAC.2